MNIIDIPLIIINFNQLTYLRNLINWWKWYYPENPIVIIDNGSTYEPIEQLYLFNDAKIKTVFYEKNDFVNNLSDYLRGVGKGHEYYCLSDPDISIHPSTPPNFLEIFKSVVDSGTHHCGFDLITDDIPKWNKKAGWIQGDEKALKQYPVTIEYEGESYEGFKAPLDSTFCLFKKSNGGWTSPMSGENWSNSVRLFKVFHLPFYLHPDYLPEEMKHYYATCLRHDVTKPATGRAHFIPEK